MIRALVTLVALAMPAPVVLADELPPPNLPGGPIQKFFAQGARVDGIPVFREEWRVWNGRNWVPLMSDEGMWRTFGIKPSLDSYTQ